MADILTVNHRLLKSLLLYTTIFLQAGGWGGGSRRIKGSVSTSQKEMARVVKCGKFVVTKE